MFICGSGSLLQQGEDKKGGSTPKRSKRSRSFCKILGKANSRKNRFSDGGLDKFYALLADLDHKKQMIYTRVGAQDISFVRFVYTVDSDRVKPIVIMANRPKKAHRAPIKKSASGMSHGVISEEAIDDRRKCLGGGGSFEMECWTRSFVYLVVILVLVLMFLAIYGRSFAIMCTWIGWYMTATVEGERERKHKRKVKGPSSSPWR